MISFSSLGRVDSKVVVVVQRREEFVDRRCGIPSFHRKQSRGDVMERSDVVRGIDAMMMIGRIGVLMKQGPCRIYAETRKMLHENRVESKPKFR